MDPETLATTTDTPPVDETPDAGPHPVDAETAPDDIPDPPVPEPLAATLEHDRNQEIRFVNAFMPTFQRFMKEADLAYQRTIDALNHKLDTIRQTVTASEAAALERLASAVQEGIAQHTQVQVRPYQSTIQAIAPSGYPITFTLEQLSADALLDAVSAHITWLVEVGFTAPRAVPIMAHAPEGAGNRPGLPVEDEDEDDDIPF